MYFVFGAVVLVGSVELALFVCFPAVLGLVVVVGAAGFFCCAVRLLSGR